MARCTSIFVINDGQQDVFGRVYQYLTSEGFEYIQYDGENVFKKGKGFLVGPTFFKLSFQGNQAKVECWRKYALFPGVYVGELVNFMKGDVTRLTNVQNLVAQNGYATAGYTRFGKNTNGADNFNPAQDFYNQFNQNNNQNNYRCGTPDQPSNEKTQSNAQMHSFCMYCGAKLTEDASFCINCGKAIK